MLFLFPFLMRQFWPRERDLWKVTQLVTGQEWCCQAPKLTLPNSTLSTAWVSPIPSCPAGFLPSLHPGSMSSSRLLFQHLCLRSLPTTPFQWVPGCPLAQLLFLFFMALPTIYNYHDCFAMFLSVCPVGMFVPWGQDICLCSLFFGPSPGKGWLTVCACVCL